MKISEISEKIDQYQHSNATLEVAIKKIDFNYDKDMYEQIMSDFDERKVRQEIN